MRIIRNALKYTIPFAIIGLLVWGIYRYTQVPPVTIPPEAQRQTIQLPINIEKPQQVTVEANKLPEY